MTIKSTHQATLLVLVLTASTLTRLSSADQPTTTTLSEIAQLNSLETLGETVYELGDYRDNFYLYCEMMEQTKSQVRQLEQSRIRFPLTVIRVVPGEVLVRVPDVGRMRIAMRHDFPPYFGNSQTLRYCSAPSARQRHMFSGPVGLRIGSEIDLETAAKLRYDDTLQVEGTIQRMVFRVDGIVEPLIAAVVGDWRVVDDQGDSQSSGAPSPN